MHYRPWKTAILRHSHDKRLHKPKTTVASLGHGGGGHCKTNVAAGNLRTDCLEALHSKETFDGCPYRDIPQAVKVPMNQAGIIPSGAFVAAPRLRHVRVEAGMRAIGAEAWQCCRHLRVVRMPNTVVRIAENTFRGCQLLNSITVLGCIDFGYKAFADCCSLQWIQANGGGVNQFGSATKLGHCLFRDCINLATFVPPGGMAAARSYRLRTRRGNCRQVV